MTDSIIVDAINYINECFIFLLKENSDLKKSVEDMKNKDLQQQYIQRLTQELAQKNVAIEILQLQLKLKNHNNNND